MSHIKVIGFDADDTLWVNETHYRAAENKFCALLGKYLPPEKVSAALFKTEMRNLELYGFGAKGFILSALETALDVSGNAVPAATLRKILRMGRGLLDFPIELLPGVPAVLKKLRPRYRLVLITKGDLLDQERKLRESGLTRYLHHVEILSNKEKRDYKDLFATLGVKPREFLMVGNSMKSDILPVLGLGGRGIYIPFHVTWQHEKMAPVRLDKTRFRQAAKISELPALLKELAG
ncbi:MAG TPA: HAD family hydrolase [Elusimicrobia bacterium]|nr:HAD family hydrolase [Elusimicrobiota bacterium]